MTRVHRPQPGNTRSVHCTHAHVQHLNRTGQLDEDVGDVIVIRLLVQVLQIQSIPFKQRKMRKA